MFIAYCIFDSIHGYQYASVVRYNGNTGQFEDEILHEYSVLIRDIALASDDLYPATNSNPFSLGVVYSTRTCYNSSIIFYSSSNGGMSFNSHYNIASSSHYFHKVALAYGRSPSCSRGR